MPSHCTCTTSGRSDRTRRSRRATLGPYSSPFSTTRARVRGARRSSRDETGRKISSRVYPCGTGTSPWTNGDVSSATSCPRRPSAEASAWSYGAVKLGGSRSAIRI